MRFVVIGLVLVAGMCTLLGWTAGLVLLVAGRVVPDWMMSGVPLVAALVLVIVNRLRRGERLDWPVRLVAVLAALGTLLGAAGDLGARYHVLRPAGDGCQVVARETSFLFAGSGEVFLVGRLGIGTRVGSYRSDDGYRPFSSDNYTLDWETGTLSIRGAPGDPVWPEVNTLNC